MTAHAVSWMQCFVEDGQRSAVDRVEREGSVLVVVCGGACWRGDVQGSWSYSLHLSVGLMT